MKRIVLLSTFVPSKEIFDLVFPADLESKVLAYMPSDGANMRAKYIEEWESYAKERGVVFNLIDNSKVDSREEVEKLMRSNILVITGGNSFTLLSNLKRSGMDKVIGDFAKKDNFVLMGMSAGALVLTPTIEVCNLPSYDNNDVGLEDLSGLSLVDFEIFPHYSKEYEEDLNIYRKRAKNKVREIVDGDSILFDL